MQNYHTIAEASRETGYSWSWIRRLIDRMFVMVRIDGNYFIRHEDYLKLIRYARKRRREIAVRKSQI